jgi:PTH1 family peptidyl-tRNA hydrolase
MTEPALLIVGLGNPGTRYTNTRHNLGATWVKRLCSKYDIELKLNNKLGANLGILQPHIICMLTTDYMNLSGISVNLVAKYYKLPVENILIIHDELDLLPGIIKLKLNGGHGGHNGLKNIMQELNSNQFKRLRIGIGHPVIKGSVVDYVLNPPEEQEKILINAAIINSLDIFSSISELNWQIAMQSLHQLNNKLNNHISGET